MTIINLNTGKARTTKKEPLPKCNICGSDYDERVGGIIGDIKYAADVNILDVAFCGICKMGIIQMLIDNNKE